MTSTLAVSPDGRVIELWQTLAHAPDALTRPGVTIVTSDQARVTRPGFCGVVAIGDAAIVTTPAVGSVDLDRLLAAAPSPVRLTDPAVVVAALGPLDATLGPADLQYGAVRSSVEGARGPFTFGHDDVQRALRSMPADERDEAGFGDDSIGSIFIATGAGDRPVALAGYRVWEGLAAHIGVVTAPRSRRRGHGLTAAGAAAAHATDRGLVVQWRSLWSNEASRHLGRSLGLVRCGRQFSFRVADR